MSTIRDTIAVATPGPWVAKSSGFDYPYIEHDGVDIASFDNIGNATYTATFDPEHIALMEDVREAASSWWRSGGENPDTVGAALLNLEGYRREHGLEVE